MIGKQVTLNELTTHLASISIKRKINEIFLHHTWSPTAAQYAGKSTWEGIRRYHVTDRGWRDIGYHIGIGPNGTIWLLRPIEDEGAHAAPRNAHSIGLVIVGNYDLGKDDPNKVLPTAAEVCAILCKWFKLPTGAISFHRDVANKSCPGTAIDRAIFRKRVEQVMTGKPAEKSQELKIVTPEGEVITAGELRDGVTWAPLRAITQHFGATLTSDTKHGKITIKQ